MRRSLLEIEVSELRGNAKYIKVEAGLHLTARITWLN